MKVKAKVKEHSLEMFELVKWAEEQVNDIAASKLDENSLKFSTILYNRLTVLTSGAACTMH